MKTETEIDNLKIRWLTNPSWDIEDTEGFEKHAKELHAFADPIRTKRGIQRVSKQQVHLRKLAVTLGCPGNIQLATYINGLETRLKEFERECEIAMASDLRVCFESHGALAILRTSSMTAAT